MPACERPFCKKITVARALAAEMAGTFTILPFVLAGSNYYYYYFVLAGTNNYCYYFVLAGSDNLGAKELPSVGGDWAQRNLGRGWGP